MRRTSLPAALLPGVHRGGGGGGGGSGSHIHQGSSNTVDSALLYEAHGLITEMLLDQGSLPPNIVAGLKALATLLKPTPTPMIHGGGNPRPRPAPLTLSSDPDYTSDVDEIPYTAGEKLSAMPKRNSVVGKKGVSGNLLRRMSTSTWTTTTSATGMPTLEPQPHSRRRRSASFRSAMEGTPGTSPTQQLLFGLVPIEDSTENTSPTPTPALTTFKMGIPYSNNTTNNNAQLPHCSTSTPHSPHGTLQSSHKSRSFSAFVLNSNSNSNSKEDSRVPPRFFFPVNSTNHAPANPHQQRNTVCSLHPLSSSDLTHLNALAASTSIGFSGGSASGSNRSTPAGTPLPSPSPSPVPSRDPSPSCNYIGGSSGRRSSELQATLEGVGAGIADSLGLLSGRNNVPDEDCSNASTLGDGPGPPESSSNSARISPVTFTVQEPNDDDNEGGGGGDGDNFSDDDYRSGLIMTEDGIKFNLQSIAGDAYLCRLHEWDYPIFELEKSSRTQILSHMCYKVFLDTGIFETFKIPIKEFISYFHALELGYRDKPYHNRMHAADVLQGVYYLSTQAIPGFQMVPPDPDTPNSDWLGQRACFSVDEGSYGVMGANLPALELMALYTAAAMHDYDHPGRTNAFLVTTNSPQAILYNDRSVLENHHAAAAWALLLNNPSYNFLKFLDKAEFKRFRFLVIEAILATDLKRHFEILSEFNSKVNEDESPGIDWGSEEDRLLVMEICIKLADINGPCKYHDIHVQWTYRIAEEFYEQGDEELRLGLPVSPFMDRYHPQLAKLQESFINHLVAPLCTACAEAGLLPGHWEDELEDEGETGDEMSYQETDNESTYSDDNRSDRGRGPGPSNINNNKRKIFCLHTKHLQDNHRYWLNVIKEETKKKEEGIKTESVAISTEDPMETIEEENTPHSLNRSFSFEKEDSKL